MKARHPDFARVGVFVLVRCVQTHSVSRALILFAALMVGCGAARPDPPRERVCEERGEEGAVAAALRAYAARYGLPAEVVSNPRVRCDVTTIRGTQRIRTDASPVFARSCWARGGPASDACEGRQDVAPTSEAREPTTYDFADDLGYGPGLFAAGYTDPELIVVEIGSYVQAFVAVVAWRERAWRVVSLGLAYTS